MSDQSPQPDVEKRPPNNNLLFAVVILIVIACVAAFVFFRDEEQPQPVVDLPPQTQPIEKYQAQKPEVADPQESVLVEPEIITPPPRKVVEPAPAVKPLPSLNDSDEVVVAKIDEYLSDQVMDLLITDDVIRRGVVFIDNLAKGKVAVKHAPVESLQESFTVIEGDILRIDPNSYERYTPYVKIFTSMSAAQIVRLYEQYKPLIGDAYSEIGYQGDEFTQTLEEAIELLLDTPEPKGDMPLLRDSVTYQYAYSEWERLPAAQKQLLRMGPDNMKKIKAALRNVQAELEK